MINPVKVVTKNVARELLRVASENKVANSDLCFRIYDYKTYIKDSDTDFVELESEDLPKFQEENALRDYTLEFEQEYDIEIRSKQVGSLLENFNAEIEFDKNNVTATFVIKKGSVLSYSDNLLSELKDYIKQLKVQSKVMLDIFDVDYEQILTQYVNIIQQVKTLTFKDDKKFLVARGLDEIESVKSRLCMNIEENNALGAEDKEGRVDYANRGFLLSCVEGEQLFEFIKPHQGLHGRSCRGEVIEVEIVNLDAKPLFTVEDSIEMEDSFDNIKYLSKKSGYLIKKGNSYDVSNTIEINEISFKTTGTINTDLDSEISIKVVKDNPLEDAVESGMNVKVQKLFITGSIGSKTKIEAREISISGQTHTESFIKCSKAKIGLHKGKIFGKTVEVNTLDGGEIVAETAIVQNAVSGKIKAKTIQIEVLGSYVTMQSCAYIRIGRAKGEENTFIIDPLLEPSSDSHKEDDKAYLKTLEEELKVLIRTFKKETEKLKEKLEPCAKIQADIIKMKNSGMPISKAFIEQFKACKIMKVRYKALKEEVEYKKSQYESVKTKVFSSDADPLDAVIETLRPLNGFNKIIYKLYNPEREIRLNAHDGMTKSKFKLIEDEEGTLQIINTD